MDRGNELNAISNNTAVSRETGIMNKLFKTAEIAYKKQLVNYEMQKQLANSLRSQQQLSENILGESQRSSKKFGEMFKNTLAFIHKTDNMAFKAFSSLIKIIKTDFSEIKGWLKGHVNDILKPISAIVDPVKALWKDVFKTSTTEDNTRETATTLDTMFNWMQMTEEDRIKWNKYNTDDNGQKKKGWKLVLGILVFIAGAIAGSIYSIYMKVFKPVVEVFKFLGNGLKSLGIFIKELVAGTRWGASLIKGISNFLGEGGMLSKVFALLGKTGAIISNFFAPLTNFIKGFKSITSIFSSAIGFFKEVGVFAKIFRLGFNIGSKLPIIGWVISGIVALFDFFKGFKATEGNIFEKLIGGLKAAVIGFLEMPLKAIGWIIESFLGLFGIQVTGIGQKMVDAVAFMFDWMISMNPIKPVIDFFVGFFSAEGTFMDKLKSGFDLMVENFIEMPKKLIEYIQSILPTWLGGKKPATGSNKIGDNNSFFGSKTPPSSSPISGMAPTMATPSATGTVGVTKGGGSVDFSGLEPSVSRNFFGMAQEYNQLTGKSIQVNSAYRSPEAQARLWDGGRNPNAAPPGRSLHEKGLAIDINSSNANELQSLGLFDKYGFTRPMSHEPWHIQPVGARSMTGSVERKSGAPAMISYKPVSSSSSPSPSGSIGSTSSSSSISATSVPSALSEAPNVDASRAGTLSATATSSENVVSSVGAMGKDVRKQTDVSAGVGNAITTSMGTISGTMSGGGESTIPTDIESFGILLYNKSWGMG